MIQFPNQVESDLIELSKSKSVYLEGNILKLVNTSSDEFQQ